MNRPRITLSLLLLVNVLAAYSNHFHNDFHFDDLPAINQNPAIRDPRAIALAFVDARLFSSAPDQRTYRPVTTASLALDYWLAGGLNVVVFHISTFVWYSVQLVLMFLLFERLMNQADPHPSNIWAALAAAAAFGLHPANAETINFIIQRGDVYNTLGCVAGLWLFVRYPSQRRFGWYLLPPAAAMLAKPPALVFPLLLLSYLLLFERKWKSAIVSVLPAAALAAAAAYLMARMQPSTWAPGATSPFLYRITQPFVALEYFKWYFWPTELSVDHGWRYLAPLSPRAMAGYFFVLFLVGAAAAASRTRRGRPVAFGIVWFIVTLLPTSLMPLGDVTNDHRMFFSFVGLTLAVFWSLRLVLFRATARLTAHRRLVYGAVGALAITLVIAGSATRARNRVWLTEESLWADAVAKNPRDVRALTNYGTYADAQADYPAALSYWDRAAELDPSCGSCEVNLVKVSLQLRRGDLADRHMKRLLAMYPSEPDPYINYAEWLASMGRFDESCRLLGQAAPLFPHLEKFWRAHLKVFRNRDAAARLALFQALDTDRDMRLSAWEIVAAPAVLAALDKNGDGKLTPEECGATREPMRSDPLFRALDSNHDGEISADEIRAASRSLLTLDRDGDGALEAPEMAPDYVTAAARRILALSDANRAPFRDLLTGADIDGDGVVTLEELSNAIFYRADRNHDGIVTAEEMVSWRGAVLSR